MSEKVTKNRIDRLLSVLKKLNLSERQFLISLGISSNWFSDIKAGRVKKISDPILLLMQYRYGINLDWILHGDNGPFIANTDHNRLSVEEVELIKLYRSTDETGQKAIIITARGASTHYPAILGKTPE